LFADQDQTRSVHDCAPTRSGGHEELTLSLRWAAHDALPDAQVITPTLWYGYVDARLAKGISPTTINTHLFAVQGLLRFLTLESTRSASKCSTSSC